MTINKFKKLKDGDLVVHVRKHYQNYDYTLIPIEPKVYTFQGTGCGSVYLHDIVKIPFKANDGNIYVSGNGWDTSLFTSCCETLEDYLDGDYNKDVILDTNKWVSLKEFLEFKRENDYNIAKENARKIREGLKS